MLERYDGEIKDDLERLFGLSYSNAPLHAIKFALYVLSNNMLTDSQIDDFLTLMISNGHWTMSILKVLLSYNLPTMQASICSILRHAIQARNLPVAKMLLESEISLDKAFKNLRTVQLLES